MNQSRAALTDPGHLDAPSRAAAIRASSPDSGSAPATTISTGTTSDRPCARYGLALYSFVALC